MKFFIAILCSVFLFNSCSSTDNADSTDDDVIVENPALKVTVTATVIDEGNGLNGVDDVVEYAISIHNTGDVILSSISIESTLIDFLDNDLSLDAAPYFESASLGSAMGSLQANEMATYAAHYTITQNEVDANGLRYSVTVNAMTPQNTSLSDISDNGDDSDGNSENDPTEIAIEFDPLIIAEYHILNSVGNPSTKYLFDANGQISKIETNNNINFDFNFDAESKLINVTTTDANDMIIESQDIIYDSENKVLSFGNRNYEFVESDPNYFIHTETFSIDGPYFFEDENGDTIEDYEIYYHKYTMGNSPLITLCYYSGNEQTNTNTGEVFEYGICSEFEYNGYINNVTGICGDTDCVDFGYDVDSINPLKGSTNLTDVYGFLRVLPFGSQPSKLNILINTNNFASMNYSDPSYLLYTYDYNVYNLPAVGYRQYVDELGPGDVNLYSKYYYQGDEIPD